MNNNFIYQARAKSEYMLWTWVNIDKSEYDTLVDNDLFDTRILIQMATRTNTCTYNVLGRLCPDCGCKRKFASNQNL